MASSEAAEEAGVSLVSLGAEVVARAWQVGARKPIAKSIAAASGALSLLLALIGASWESHVRGSSTRCALLSYYHWLA